MVTCATVMKSLLVAAIVVVFTGQGSADVEKLAECCTEVNSEKITEPIVGFLTQAKAGKCVNAVIFQTETGFFCSKFDAPWVRRKIRELMVRERARTNSLLNLITSSASPPSTSTSFTSRTITN